MDSDLLFLNPIYFVQIQTTVCRKGVNKEAIIRTTTVHDLALLLVLLPNFMISRNILRVGYYLQRAKESKFA